MRYHELTQPVFLVHVKMKLNYYEQNETGLNWLETHLTVAVGEVSQSEQSRNLYFVVPS